MSTKILTIFTLSILILGIANATTLKEIYAEVKSKAKTWKVADIDDVQLSDTNFDDFAQYFPMDPTLTLTADSTFSSDYAKDKRVSTLPTAFDAREKWPECIHGVRNQGPCGSCYAHGSSEVLSDRFCIHSNGKVNVNLSPQDAVSCGRTFCNGCGGCVYPYLWMYWHYHGAVTEECFPYKGIEEPCLISNKQCVTPGVEYKKYYVKRASQRYPYRNVEQIKEEIMTNGPVSAIMLITPDYLLYKGGVFVPTTDQIVGSHLFKILGWGVDGPTGLEYWLVQDSMGVGFGEEGYSRIKMGVLGIDSHMSWAMPDL